MAAGFSTWDWQPISAVVNYITQIILAALGIMVLLVLSENHKENKALKNSFKILAILSIPFAVFGGFTQFMASRYAPTSQTPVSVTVEVSQSLAKIAPDFHNLGVGSRHDLLIPFAVTNDYSIDKFTATASVISGDAKISDFDLEAEPSLGNPKYSPDNKSCSLSCFPQNRANGLLYVLVSAVPCEVSLTSPLLDGQIILEFSSTNTIKAYMK